MKELRVNELFTSIEGEVSGHGQGGFTSFLRLAGCNLRCDYCDTQYSQEEDSGDLFSLEEILEIIRSHSGPYTYPLLRRVTITGGEPLLQEEPLLELIRSLLARKYLVNIETNGSIHIPYLLKRRQGLSWTVDYKLGHQEKSMHLTNFLDLPPHNWIKFVIQDEEEYKYAVLRKSELKRSRDCAARVAFSPVWGRVDPKELVFWLQRDRQWDVFLNLQLHKILEVK